LPFESSDKSGGGGYDIVCAFDVMHHVSDPVKMAKEIIRITKHYFFLCEPNGLSVIRRIGELSSYSKKLEEKSYYPWEYKKYFMQNGAKKIDIKPFYFFVPPKIKKENMKVFIKISEFGQTIPVLRWQSQSLAIFGEK
jgi:2-polyprenyl-3-methyl-5-hydroxy-6-metoxy-1,4-benzoquinol methylase